MKRKPSEFPPCYRCGGNIFIFPTEGGRGTGDMTLYRAACIGKGQYERDGCGMFQAYLGSDGTVRNAIAHYKKLAKAMTPHSQGVDS